MMLIHACGPLGRGDQSCTWIIDYVSTSINNPLSAVIPVVAFPAVGQSLYC